MSCAPWPAILRRWKVEFGDPFDNVITFTPTVLQQASPKIHQQAGRKLLLGWQRPRGGTGCCFWWAVHIKAEHLELPCGPSIWPDSHLPEPDAPKQLWAKQHESFRGEGHKHTHMLTHTSHTHTGAPTTTLIRLLKAMNMQQALKLLGGLICQIVHISLRWSNTLRAW